MEENFIEFEFNYASISSEPFGDDKESSSRLLKNIFLKLSEKDFPSNERIIDRHKNHKNKPKRELVIISNRFGEQGKRCFGKIALIKNKTPLLWHGKDIIEELEKAENKQFIEVTNFIINFNNNSDPVIMIEYNYEGPRLSDLEFYIRQIAKKYKIAKKIKTILHLNTNYEELDRNMQNIFSVNVKVNSSYNNRFDWLKVLKNLNDDAGFKDIRLEMFFKRQKNKDGFYEKNIRGMDFARNILNWIKKDKNNIKYLEDLKMSYQLKDDEEIIDLDFLKNKVVSILKVTLTDGKLYKTSDFIHIIGQELNFYLKNGYTTTSNK